MTLNSSTHTLVTALPGMRALPTRRQNFHSNREGNLEQRQQAALRLAKQKQEFELEQLKEENRKRLAEVHLVFR